MEGEPKQSCITERPGSVIHDPAGQVGKIESHLWWMKVVSILGIEVQGAEPIPAHLQTERQYFKLSTLWFSMNFNLIAVSTGISGTLIYGMNLRDCSLVVIFFGLLTGLAAPYLSIWGSKLGLRQMVHARYTFGKYVVVVPLLLNMATLAGYAIIGCILGGQAISAAGDGNVSVNVGIVVLAIITLVVIFCGSQWIHHFDLCAWIPSLVAVIGALGTGGKHLHQQVDAPPATAALVMSYGALVAGFFLPWSAVASDFTTYYDRRSNGFAIFVPSYLGLVSGGIPPIILGAAIGGAIPNVSSWQDGYNSNSVGGVMGAMLEPVGGFGKFLLVLLALSVLANVVGTVYALTLNCQALMYLVRVRMPRVVYAVALIAIVIPVAIKVAAKFLDSLNNFLGIICYWPACFVAALAAEHWVFRREVGYDTSQWDLVRELPSGVAALAASALSFALVIPSMSQVWFVGPIAGNSGDIGFEMAFVLTAIFYIPFRCLEVRHRGRRV